MSPVRVHDWQPSEVRSWLKPPLDAQVVALLRVRDDVASDVGSKGSIRTYFKPEEGGAYFNRIREEIKMITLTLEEQSLVARVFKRLSRRASRSITVDQLLADWSNFIAEVARASN